MPLAFECSISIAAPAERVFAALADPEQVKQWMPDFVRFEMLTQGPMGKGSSFRSTRKMFGREATEQFDVTEFDPPRVLSYYVDGAKGSSKCGWFKFRQTVIPQGDRSLLSLSGEIGGTSGCMAFLGKMMMGPMKKAMRKDLEALKAFCERGAA